MENNEILLLKQEIQKKNEIIENLQKENSLIIKRNEDNISLLGKEIENIKQKYDKEIYSLKEYFTKEINSLKEELVKKDDKKRKNELKTIKEDISILNEKYSNFERVFDNKLDFIESSLSKLMNKQGLKNDNKKDIENKLCNIFKEQNDNQKHIDEKDMQELKDLAFILINSGGSPLKECTNFFEKYLNKRISEIDNQEILKNLIAKKDEIFIFLDELECELNFDIYKFRKEFNLSEEEFTNEFLISKFKENNGDKTKTFYAIINQKNF